MKILWTCFWLTFMVWIIDKCSSSVTIGRLGEVVYTDKGSVQGVVVEFPRDRNLYLRPVEAFLGLPYSTAIIPETRFLPSRNIDDRYGPPIARKVGVPCPQQLWKLRTLRRWFPEGVAQLRRRIAQFIRETSEDCLTLNLYRPTYKSSNTSQPYPVLVFVHGESYDTGTGNAYDGSVLASYGEIIVITINYRLGVLGFLNIGHPDAYGNQALSDIKAVLSWVNVNIGFFGGDPSRVTLLGHGHGAALVNLLLLMPNQKEGKLFRRAILHSGSALSPWAFAVDPLACAERLALNVNCTEYINNSLDLIVCLRNRSANDLVTNTPIPPKYTSCFAPTLSGTGFYGETVFQLLNDQTSLFSETEVMFGVTKNEAYSYLKQNELELGITNFRKTQIIRTYVQNNFKYHRQKIFDILEHHYSDWDRSQTDETRRDNIMEMISDGQFTAPLIQMAQEHAKIGPSTYMYMFGYSTQSEDFPKWSSGVHGGELPYIFGAPLVDGIAPFPSKYTKGEKRLGASMMRLWTNFVKSGNPNLPVNQTVYKDDKFKDIMWQPYSLEKQRYLQIGRRPLVRHHYRGKHLALWLELLPKINEEIHYPGMVKPDSAEHNLMDPKNMTTFDDPNRLLVHFHRISSLSPILQITSPQRDGIGKSTNSGYETENDTTTKFLESAGIPSNKSDVNRISKENQVTEVTGMESLVQKSIPLSIIVAIGCSLLFINILVLAAVCYQRKRIQLLRSGYLHAKDDQFTKQRKSLTSEDKADDVDKCMEIQSWKSEGPQRNAIYSQPIKPIRTMYPMQTNATCNNYSYSPVSTITSSPAHKEKNINTTTNVVSGEYKDFTSFQTAEPPSTKTLSTFTTKNSCHSTTTVV